MYSNHENLKTRADTYLYLKFYGEPFFSLFMDWMENTANLPADECQHLAATLYYQIYDRNNTLSSDLNSVLDFADKIIIKEEGEKFIRLLEKIAVYPQQFDAEDISHRIIDTVFLNPKDRLIQSSSWRMFVEGLNTYLSKNYRGGQPIIIPDPPQDKRRKKPPNLEDGLTFKLNYTLATRSLDEPSEANDKLITIPTVVTINDIPKNLRRFAAPIDNNHRYSNFNNDMGHMRYYGTQPKKFTIQPIQGRQQSAYNEYNTRDEKGIKFLRRLKEASFKKNTGSIVKDIINKNNNEDKNNNNANNNEKTSNSLKQKRRQFDPTVTDWTNIGLDLSSELKMLSTTFPYTFSELVINVETTTNNLFKAFNMPPVFEINNGKDIPDLYKAMGRQNNPPGFPPDMFKPPAEEKSNFKLNNFNPLNLNPNNVSPLNLTSNNVSALDLNPNNVSALDLNPNYFDSLNLNSNDLNAAKLSGLSDPFWNLPNKIPFDQTETTVTNVILNIPSENIPVDRISIEVKPRNGEDIRLSEKKDRETTMRRKKKRKRKSTTIAPTKMGLNNQIKKYVNYAKHIITTKVHSVEHKLKRIQQSKETITIDRTNEPRSREKIENDVSDETKNIESISEKKKHDAKKKEEGRESLDLTDSIQISEITDDNNYGVDKDLLKKLRKRHKHRKIKKQRRHLRNDNKKYKITHRHRRKHKKHRHNKHKKHHRHRHKKHHKYKYLILDSVRRNNHRERSYLYSQEHNNKYNTSPSAENSQDNSKTNSENEKLNNNNNKYQALREKPVLTNILGRNTRFYIVKNVRSGVSTPEQPDINNPAFHKRFNIIGNEVKQHMTIISAGLDIDKRKPSVLNQTTDKSVKANEHIYTDYSSSGSSIESNDGLSIDRWKKKTPKEPETTNTAETLIITPVEQKATENPKNRGKQTDLNSMDVLNDSDYLSRKDEEIFSDWLRTVDRLRFTPELKNRRSFNTIRSTLKSKRTTKNVKSFLFFKASKEYEFRPKIQKETSSSEKYIVPRAKKHAKRRKNDMNPVVESSLKLIEAINLKSSLEFTLENLDVYVNDTNKPGYPYYSSRKKYVKKRKIKKITNTAQSHEEEIVKNLAKQFQVLDKINKKFDKARTTNSHGHNNYDSTDVTQEFDVEKYLDLDVSIHDSSNDFDNYKAYKIVKDSKESQQKTDLKEKQNTTVTNTMPNITTTRKTIEKIRQIKKKAPNEYGIVTTLRQEEKNTEKVIIVNDYEYEPLSYYSDSFSTIDQTTSLKKKDLTNLLKEPGNLKSHSEEFMSNDSTNASEKTHIATKYKKFRRNRSVENRQKRFSSISTSLPEKIKIKLLKRLAKITNYNETLRRQIKKLKDMESISESRDDERILKNNIYKYFGHNEKVQHEHDALIEQWSYMTKDNNVTGDID